MNYDDDADDDAADGDDDDDAADARFSRRRRSHVQPAQPSAAGRHVYIYIPAGEAGKGAGPPAAGADAPEGAWQRAHGAQFLTQKKTT